MVTMLAALAVSTLVPLTPMSVGPTAQGTQSDAPVVIDVLGAPDGTRRVFEITRERSARLVSWDETSMPSLSIAQATETANGWLLSHTKNAQRFDLASIVLTRAGQCATGCWHYRLTFDATIDGRRIPGGVNFALVVLLDGSVVESRAESAPPSSSAAGQGVVAPQPGPDGVYRVGGLIAPPRALNQPKPKYTAQAMRARIQGRVLVEAVVKVDGKLSDVRVARSLDSVYGLDHEALECAKEWRFAPATLNGKPVPVRVTIEISFALSDGPVR